MALKNAFIFAYGYSMQCEVCNKCDVPLTDVDSVLRSDEKEGVEDDLYRNTLTVEIPGERDENGAMHLWPDYCTDAQSEDESDGKVRILSFNFHHTIRFDKLCSENVFLLCFAPGGCKKMVSCEKL